MPPAIAKLRNPILNYSWGSRHFIANLQKRPAPSAEPEAELWIGAHPRAPSVLANDPSTSLADLIRRDPKLALGSQSVERFGPSLPFLVKILAAAQPLSIQVHPDAEQARRGFDEENSAGIPLDAPLRSYPDPQRKIELLIALEPTHALCGFRSIDSALPLLEKVGSEVTKALTLHGREDEKSFASRIFHAMRGLSAGSRGQLVAEVVDFAERERLNLAEAEWVRALAAAHPTDPGILAPLLLNLVQLEHAEALIIPPRTVHAYLRGSGLEVMSSSDNVLRGGLTPKFVNKVEMKRVAQPRSIEPEVIRGRSEATGTLHYSSQTHSVPEFSVRSHKIDPSRPEIQLPAQPAAQILACLEGTIRIEPQSALGAPAGQNALELSPGDAAWIPARAATLSVNAAHQGGDSATFYAVTTG